MSNESKQNSSLRDFTISMHCITFTICLTMIDASLPEDFDRSLLHKIKKLAEDCETPASLNKLLNSSKELEKKTSCLSCFREYKGICYLYYSGV